MVDRKVGARQLGVRVGLGYGRASKALLIFNAAFMHFRADSGLLKGETSLDSTGSGEVVPAVEDGAITEFPECSES